MSFRGIYGILPTPFCEDLSLDEKGLIRMVDFCVKAGSHGIVTPVNASEYIALSDDERKLVVQLTVEHTAGRVPVIAGVAGVSTPVAAMFARHAREVGADGIIAMPPYISKASKQEIFEYYRTIAEASELPVFIQNYIPPVGTPMSAADCIDIIGKVENVYYVKEETQYSGHVLTEIEELAGVLPQGKYLGTMGGKAGRYLIDEYNRGCCGNMPACEIVDVQAQIWNLLEAGEEDKAIEVYYQAIPLLNMEYMYGYVLYKEVLRRRGVIDSAAVRAPGVCQLDAMDHKELDRVMKAVEPYFKV